MGFDDVIMKRAKDPFDMFFKDSIIQGDDFRRRLSASNNLDRIGRVFRGKPLTEAECVEFLSFFVCPDFVIEDRIFLKKFTFFLSFFDKDIYVIYLFSVFSIQDFYYFLRCSIVTYVFLAWLAIDYKSSFDVLKEQFGFTKRFEMRIVEEVRRYRNLVLELYYEGGHERRQEELLLYDVLFKRRMEGNVALTLDNLEEFACFLRSFDNSLKRVKRKVLNRTVTNSWLYLEELPKAFEEIKKFFSYTKVAGEFFTGFFDENFYFYFYFIFSNFFKKLFPSFLRLVSLKIDCEKVSIYFLKIRGYVSDLVTGFIRKIMYFLRLQYFTDVRGLALLPSVKLNLLRPNSIFSIGDRSFYEQIFTSYKKLSSYLNFSNFFYEDFLNFTDAHKNLLLVFAGSMGFQQKLIFFFVFRFSFFIDFADVNSIYRSEVVYKFFLLCLTKFSTITFVQRNGEFHFTNWFGETMRVWFILMSKFKVGYVNYVANYHKLKGLREFKYVPLDYRIMNDVNEFMSLFHTDLMVNSLETVLTPYNLHQDLIDEMDIVDDEENEERSLFDFMLAETEASDPMMSVFSVLDFGYFLNERDHVLSPGINNPSESQKGTLLIKHALTRAFIDKFVGRVRALKATSRINFLDELSNLSDIVWSRHYKNMEDFKVVLNAVGGDIEDDFVVAYVRYVNEEFKDFVMTFEDFLRSRYTARVREIEMFVELEVSKWNYFWPGCLYECFGKEPDSLVLVRLSAGVFTKGAIKFYRMLLKLSAFLTEETFSIYNRELRWDNAFDAEIEKYVGVDTLAYNVGDFSALQQDGQFGDAVMGFNEVELYNLRRIYEFAFLVGRGNRRYKSPYQRRVVRRNAQIHGWEVATEMGMDEKEHSFGVPRLRSFSRQYKGGFLSRGFFKHNFHYVGLNEFEGVFSGIYDKLFFFGKKLSEVDDPDSSAGTFKSFYNREFWGESTKGDDNYVTGHEDPAARDTGLVVRVLEKFDGLNFLNFYNFWWGQCLSEDLDSFYERWQKLAGLGVFPPYVKFFAVFFERLLGGLYTDRGFLKPFFENIENRGELGLLAVSFMSSKKEDEFANFTVKYDSCYVVVGNFFKLLLIDKMSITASFENKTKSHYNLRVLLCSSLLQGLESLRNKGLIKFRRYYKFFLISFVLFFWKNLHKCLCKFVVINNSKLVLEDTLFILHCLGKSVVDDFYNELVVDIGKYLHRFNLMTQLVTYKKFFFFFYKGYFKLSMREVMSVFLGLRMLFSVIKSACGTIATSGSVDTEFSFDSVRGNFSSVGLGFKEYASSLNYFSSQTENVYCRGLTNREFVSWLISNKKDGVFDAEGFDRLYKLRQYLFLKEVYVREVTKYGDHDAVVAAAASVNKLYLESFMKEVNYGDENKSDFNYIDYKKEDLCAELNDVSVYSTFTGWDDGNIFIGEDVCDGDYQISYEFSEMDFFDTFLFSEGALVRDYTGLGEYEDFVNEIDSISDYPINDYVQSFDESPSAKVIYPSAYRLYNYIIYVIQAFCFGGLNEKLLSFYKANIGDVLVSNKLTGDKNEKFFFEEQDFGGFFKHSKSLSVGIVDQIYQQHFYADLDFLASPFSLLVEYGVPYERRMEYLGFSKDLVTFSGNQVVVDRNKRLFLQNEITLYFVERLKLRLTRRAIDEFDQFVKDNSNGNVFYNENMLWKVKVDYLFRKFFAWLLQYQLERFNRVNVSKGLLFLVHKLVFSYVSWQRKVRDVFFDLELQFAEGSSNFFVEAGVLTYFHGFTSKVKVDYLYVTYKNCGFLDLLKISGAFANLMPFEFFQKLRRFSLLFQLFKGQLNFYSLLYLEEEVDLFFLQFPTVSNQQLWRFILEVRNRLKYEEFVFLKNYYALFQVGVKYGLRELLYYYESKLRYLELKVSEPWYFSLITFVKELFIFSLYVFVLFVIGSEHGVYFFDYIYHDYDTNVPQYENDYAMILDPNTGGKRALGYGFFFPY